MLLLQGRRDCDFSVNPGPNSCIDGGCNGGLECDTVGGTVWLAVASREFHESFVNAGCSSCIIGRVYARRWWCRLLRWFVLSDSMRVLS